jgi:hypothetical protein
MEIDWVDTGAAMLIVAPGGESLLVDTANPTPDDRDAKRIMAAQAYEPQDLAIEPHHNRVCARRPR